MEYELAYHHLHHHNSDPYYQLDTFRGSLSTSGESECFKLTKSYIDFKVGRSRGVVLTPKLGAPPSTRYFGTECMEPPKLGVR